MKKHNKGFSLIEVMIVVAIIGILAAVASTYYQHYLNRTHVASALYDIFPSKVQVEIRINDGETALTPALVGLGTQTNNCSDITVDFDHTTGEAIVTCVMKGSPSVINRTIAVSRSTAGLWSCVTGTTSGVATLDPDYIPRGCI